MASGGDALSRGSCAGHPITAGEGMTLGESDVAVFDPLLPEVGSEHRILGATSNLALRFAATAQGVHDAEEYCTLEFEHANSAPWPLRMDVLVPWLCELDRLASGETWGVSPVRGTSAAGAGIATSHGRAYGATAEWSAMSASPSGDRLRRGHSFVSDPRYPDGFQIREWD